MSDDDDVDVDRDAAAPPSIRPDAYLLPSSTRSESNSVPSPVEVDESGVTAEAASPWRERMSSLLEAVERAVFNHIAFVTIVGQFVVVLIVNYISSDSFNDNRLHEHQTMEAIVWIIEILLAVVNTLANLDAARSIENSIVSLATLIRLYICSALSFAGLYYACFLVDAGSFGFKQEFGRSPSTVFTMYFYYSFVTLSTAGFGDIVPVQFASQTLTCVQMLSSVVYSVAIFAVGTTHVRIRRELHQSGNADDSSTHLNVDTLAERMTFASERYVPGYRQWWGVWVRKAPILFTCATLALCFLIVLVLQVDFSDIANPSAKLVFTAFLILILQCINFIVVLMTSFVLVRKINAEEVTPLFLLQSYLSTALLFGGIYFTVFVIAGRSSFNLAVRPDSQRSIAELLFHFGYFAISSQTGCGFGDYYPTSSVTRVLVSFHLLVSMIYTAIILGLGLSHLVDRIVPSRIMSTMSKSGGVLIGPRRPAPIR